MAVPCPVGSREGVYAIIGVDGSGKTTVARGVLAALRAQGRRPTMPWMRQPRFLSYAPIAYFRVTGLARTVRHGGHDDVHTDLKGRPFLAHLFAWLVTFDYFLGFWAKVSLRRLLGFTVVCDRFVWDALVDLMLATGQGEAFLATPAGDILVRLGRRYRAVLLRAPTETLLHRRPILGLDPRLQERLGFYEALATRNGLGVVDSGAHDERESAARVIALLGLQ